MYTKGKQLLIGLPGTGKTTFLGALWYVVNNREVPGALHLKKLDTERAHIERICQDWLAGKEVERTHGGNEQQVVMKLGGAGAAEITELVFPDLSGETFRQQWREGVWTIEFDEIASTATGILLFVHPRRVFRGELIGPQVAELIENVTGENVEEENLEEQGEEEIAFNPDKSPTQVQMVELIQFLLRRELLVSPLSVVVIVSAWDL